MENLNKAIASAKKVITANNLPFATIWKTGKLYGFNFEKQEVGYTIEEYGVKRTVVAIVTNRLIINP